MFDEDRLFGADPAEDVDESPLRIASSRDFSCATPIAGDDASSEDDDLLHEDPLQFITRCALGSPSRDDALLLGSVLTTPSLAAKYASTFQEFMRPSSLSPHDQAEHSWGRYKSLCARLQELRSGREELTELQSILITNLQILIPYVYLAQPAPSYHPYRVLADRFATRPKLVMSPLLSGSVPSAASTYCLAPSGSEATVAPAAPPRLPHLRGTPAASSPVLSTASRVAEGSRPLSRAAFPPTPPSRGLTAITRGRAPGLVPLHSRPFR